MLPVEEFEAAVPEELKRLRQWVFWGPDPESGKAKCPLILTARDRRASSTKGDTWREWKTAKAVYAKYAVEGETGVGFVFTKAAGLCYIDIDDAIDEDGKVRDWARPYVLPFAGKAYIEDSPSRRGLHIIARGELPVPNVAGGKVNKPEVASDWAKAKMKVPEVAFFCERKYTTITGYVRRDNNKLAQDCSEEIAAAWELAGVRATAADAEHGPAPKADDLPEVPAKKVPKEVKEELEECSAADAEDRSAARFKLYCQAAKKLEPEEIFALVTDSEWYELSGAEEKGLDHTWNDICRACAKTDSARKDFAEFVEEEEEKEKTRAQEWKELGVPMVITQREGGPEYEAVWGVRPMVIVLTRHPKWKGRVRLNSFKEVVEVDGKPLNGTVSHIAEELRDYLRWTREPNLDHVRTALAEAGEANSYNPLHEELESLTWDGRLRLTDWLVRAGCEDTAVARIVARKWLVSLVARALKPGCKVDTVLILEGKQGTKKSTFFRTLAGEGRFTDTHVNFDRDGMMVIHGHWIVELAELATFKKSENERVKQFLSGQMDTFRLPYGRATVTKPRHFLVVGTTNDDDYLQDQTGHRRFWPVRVDADKLDVAWLEENRDQLLAEAVVAFKAGESWWFDVQPDALTEAQEDREVTDGLVERVAEVIVGENANSEFKIVDLMGLLSLDTTRKDLTQRVAMALRKLGWRRRKKRIDGNPEWVWSRDGEALGGAGKVLAFPAGNASEGEGKGKKGSEE